MMCGLCICNLGIGKSKAVQDGFEENKKRTWKQTKCDNEISGQRCSVMTSTPVAHCWSTVSVLVLRKAATLSSFFFPFGRNLEKWDSALWCDPSNPWLTTSTPSDKRIFVDAAIDIQVNAGSSKCWLRRDLSARTSSLSPLSALHFKKLRKCSAPCWLIQNVPDRVPLFKVHVVRR